MVRLAVGGALLGLAVAGGMDGCAGQAPNGGWDGTGPPPKTALEITDLRERAVALLLKETSSAAPEARANSVEALGRTPGRLKKVLARMLGDENLGVRAVAAMVVGRAKMQDQASLVRPLLSDASPFVRMSAIYALVRCGEPVDPTPMAGFLMNDSPRVRAQAAFLLGEIGDATALPMVKDASRDAMTRASPPEVRLMQLQMAEARVKLGEEPAIHEIRAALYPARPEALEATALAAQIIGQVNDRAGIDQLIYLTAKWDPKKQPMPGEVRLAAAGSLARLGITRGTFLANEYSKDKSASLRAQAAHVYGMTGQEANLSVLETMMGDPSELVRVSAAAAVLRLTDRVAAGTGPGGSEH